MEPRMCPACREYGVSLEEWEIDTGCDEARRFAQDYNVVLTSEFILRFLSLLFPSDGEDLS